MGTVGLSRCMQSHRSVAQTRKMFQSVVSVPLLVLVVALSAPLCQPRPQLDFLTNMLGNTVEAVSSVLKDYDTAPYTVITTHPGGVEEREYPAMSWVCHQRTKSEGRNGMFMSLFRYITGANADSAKIDMTTPVTTLNVQDPGSSEVTLEMCFFLGGRSSPPSPTEEGVYLKQEKTRRIVTRTVGGYMDDQKWAREAETLQGIISDLGISVVPNRHYEVGYDAPFKFWNRRNEVWFLKA